MHGLQRRTILCRKPCCRFCQDIISWSPLPQEVDSALYEFDRAVKDKEVLLGVATTDFRPMVEQGKWSQHYLGDNMYDLLLRQSIFQLLWNGGGNKAVQLAVFDKYEKLIARYEAVGNRETQI